MSVVVVVVVVVMERCADVSLHTLQIREHGIARSLQKHHLLLFLLLLLYREVWRPTRGLLTSIYL